VTVELGLVIGKRGRDISKTNAYSHVAGYGMFPCFSYIVVTYNTECAFRQALAVDMTAHNFLNKLRDQQMAWSISKGFDTFTPIGYVLGFIILAATDSRLTGLSYQKRP
jgi:acylpyruvate hydrolase